MNNIKLERNFKAESLPLVCDPHQLEQALLAVEINSVEAMPDGGVLTISVTPEEQSAMIRIDISDTGVGIRNEDLPHVFEPFFTTKHDGKGTGLGLAVVYGIVKRHGGTVEIRSQITTGTTLSIRLPRQPANQPAHEVSFLGRES
jgi:signal transduction histidine kinase